MDNYTLHDGKKWANLEAKRTRHSTMVNRNNPQSYSNPRPGRLTPHIPKT